MCLCVAWHNIAPYRKSSTEMRGTMRINHNVSAQMSNVNLKKTDARLSSSLERLTSGYKINKAADDAAGMAISNKMRAQIRSLNQSSRNAGDGQSIIETAEGGLHEIQSILQRIRELSVEAGNDTYNLDDRKTIQTEIDEMLKEIDRIAETTEFNGTPLLDGSAARTISSNSANVDAVSVSMSVEKGDYMFEITQLAEKAQGQITMPDIPGSVTINEEAIYFNESDTTDSIRKKVMVVCDAMGIDVTNNGFPMELQTRATGSNQRIKIQYPGEEAVLNTGKDVKIDIITSENPESKFAASATYSADGNFVRISDNDEFEIQLEVGEDAQRNDIITFSVYDAGYMTIQIGANEGQTLDMNFPKVSCLNLGLKDSYGVDKINCCTQLGATNAIASLDEALQKISNARSVLGSYQNRLESTVSSLDLTSQNITEAMSRISDTDMAEEMTQYTQMDILSQAATSMLAQANNRPQQVMGLLQG